MPLSLQDRQNRYLIQAQWTRALERVLSNSHDLQALTPADIYGADILEEHLIFAKKICPECCLTGADVHHLPYKDNAFDMVLSHYFLMWTGNPKKALIEMCRITKPGGYLVAFAEPDYGGRIDYQISGLLNSGADPKLGRKLPSLFHEVGLAEIQTGVYEGGWGKQPSPEEIKSEWQVLEEDLAEILPQVEIQELKKHELSTWENGSRLIYVPTFYAWGKVTK